MAEKVFSNGQWVVPGLVKVSKFLREVTKEHGNERFDGSFEELEALTTEHFKNSEPGIGSVDSDVLLVTVPSERFWTNIIHISKIDESSIVEVSEARVEGEAPVTKRVVVGDRATAAFVKIVVYRADTLAKDADRSSEAEWEIVAINTQPYAYVPMHPTTMLRNARNETGGTYREYTSEQWEEAYEFWDSHVYIVSSLDEL